MKDFANGVIAAICFWRHLIPVLWSHTRGGFFCFRNSPLWVVQEVAEIEEDDGSPDWFKDIQEQARDEISMRARRGEGVGA